MTLPEILAAVVFVAFVAVLAYKSSDRVRNVVDKAVGRFDRVQPPTSEK